MNLRVNPVLVLGALTWVLAEPVQAGMLATQGSLPLVAALTSSEPPPAQGAASSSPQGSSSPAPQAASSPAPHAAPPGSVPAPGSSETPSSHAHFSRPGTEVDADSFAGSLASDVFVLKGNVVLHSDPKVDRAIGDLSQSGEPLTVTADEIDIDRDGLSYVAKGNVHFTQGSRSGKADLAMLNEAAHTIDLVGNANVLEGDHRAAAEKMHYNLRDKDFRGSGDVRIYEPVPTPNPNASSTPAPKKRRRRLPL